jgi:hypothetical protein
MGLQSLLQGYLYLYLEVTKLETVHRVNFYLHHTGFSLGFLFDAENDGCVFL